MPPTSAYLPPTAPSTAHILHSIERCVRVPSLSKTRSAIDSTANKISRWSKAKMPTNRALAMLPLRVHTHPSSASFRELQNKNTQQRSRRDSVSQGSIKCSISSSDMLPNCMNCSLHRPSRPSLAWRQCFPFSPPPSSITGYCCGETLFAESR